MSESVRLTALVYPECILRTPPPVEVCIRISFAEKEQVQNRQDRLRSWEVVGQKLAKVYCQSCSACRRLSCYLSFSAYLSSPHRRTPSAASHTSSTQSIQIATSHRTAKGRLSSTRRMRSLTHPQAQDSTISTSHPTRWGRTRWASPSHLWPRQSMEQLS